MFCAKMILYLHVAPIKWFVRYYRLVFVIFSQGESVELFLTQLKLCIHMYM